MREVRLSYYLILPESLRYLPNTFPLVFSLWVARGITQKNSLIKTKLNTSYEGKPEVILSRCSVKVLLFIWIKVAACAPGTKLKSKTVYEFLFSFVLSTLYFSFLKPFFYYLKKKIENADKQEEEKKLSPLPTLEWPLATHRRAARQVLYT